MSWLDVFRRRPAVARAFDPPPYFFGKERVGLTTTGSPSTEALLTATRGWQAIGAGAIADRFQSLEPIVVVQRTKVSGTKTEEELDQHPLKALLDRPNPIFTRVQLMRILAYSIVQAGEGYWLKVRDRIGVTRELWPLPSSRMELIADRDTMIGGYVYRGDREEITYQPDEVLRFWMPDPAYPFLALGNLRPQSVAFDASTFADETLRDYFGNDATPKVALVAKDNATAPTPDQRKAFETDWRARYHQRRGTARGLPALIPSDYGIHEFGGKSDSADQVALLDHYRDQILMANGVPRSIRGDVVDANRAAAETNQYVFDRHTILPITEMVAATMTMHLAGDFDSKLIVRFREFVADDKDFRLREEAQDLLTKVRSVNQVREDRGLDPVAWGDEPVGSFGDVPYNPDDQREAAALKADDPQAFDAPADGEEDDAEEGRSYARALEARPDVVKAWQALLARERKWTPRMAHALRQIFTEQRRDVVAQLERVERSGGVTRAIDLRDLFTVEMWRSLFARVFEPIRKAAFLDTSAEVYRELSLPPGSFKFSKEVERTLARQGADLVSLVNETTRRRLQRELIESTAKGEPLRDLVARVNRVFKGRRANAATIARTEVTRSTQAAQVESFRQSGVVEAREWHTAQDADVRDSHQIDGQVRSMHEPFELANGELAEAPGVGWQGTVLSPENAINCRCFLVPVVE